MKSINNIRSIFKERPNTQLILKNIVSLSAIQAVTYLIPLITIPYLLRIIGTYHFGLLAFAASFTAYFQMILDYGFGITATRSIAVHCDDKNAINETVTDVVSIKCILSFISATIIVPLIFCIPSFNMYAELYIWSFVVIVGSTFTPMWFFQGFEQSNHLAWLTIVFRLISTALIFVVVRLPEDYLKVVYLNAASTWLIALAASGIMIQRYHVRLTKLSYTRIILLLRCGWPIFTSQVWVTFFTNSNTFVLGLLTDTVTVGRYAVAEKIARAFIFLSAPIGNALLPRSSAMFKQSYANAMQFLSKVFIYGTTAFTVISLVLFLSADMLVYLFCGKHDSTIATALRILSILPLTVFMDNIFGTQILLNQGGERQFSRVIFVSGIASLMCLCLLSRPLGVLGPAISFAFSEILVLIGMFVFTYRRGVRLNMQRL